MAEILKGAPVADALNEKLAAEVRELREAGVTPTLAIVRVGERADDIAYERGAVKRCGKAGIEVRSEALPANAAEEELTARLRELNADKSVHGVLLLRPLPRTMDEDRVRNTLAPEKDVDGITDASLAGVFAGTGEGYPPCTAQACIELLDYYGVQLKGSRVTVVGRSLVVGKPVAMLLLGRHATVTVCHTRTADMPAACRGAEILIVSAGRAGVVGKAHLSPGQTVVDVGINADEAGAICGDVKFEDALAVAAGVTPVPGGVGTVTTGVLAKHVVQAARRGAGCVS